MQVIIALGGYWCAMTFVTNPRTRIASALVYHNTPILYTYVRTQQRDQLSHSNPKIAAINSIMRLQFALLGCAVGSALIVNLTSPTNSHITETSAIHDHLRLDSEVPNLISEARCTGPKSGVGLNNAMCQEALTDGIPHVISASVITYGDRRIGNFDVNLPQRYISGQ